MDKNEQKGAILTDDNYVDKAEKAIKSIGRIPKKDKKGNIIKYNGKVVYLENKYKFQLTITKIRKLLALTSKLYDDSKTKFYEELLVDISYLRVQFVYQSGRESERNGKELIYPVKDFVEKAEILEILKEIQDEKDDEESIKKLQRFCRYMEALVAYFKYYGGKDQ